MSTDGVGEFDDEDTVPEAGPGDRRGEDRISASFQVEYESFDDFIVAYTTDISQGGLFMDGAELLPTGVVVRLVLRLPDDGPTLKIIARVAYTIDNEERRGMGMEFLHVEGGPIEDQLVGYLTLHMIDEAVDDTGPPATVLVVDDDAAYRRQAEMVMEKLGHTVETAENGLEGLGMVLRDPPDLILSDVEMPTMDGWQLLRMLRARPSVAHIPVIFLTNLGGENERLKGYRLGVDDYIPKPFLFEELSARVTRVLARSRSRAPSSTRNALRGDLAMVSLVSVLQFVEIEKRTGLLLVIAGKNVATLHIREGRVVAVDLGEMSAETGVERLFRVLGWTTGRFELTQADVSIEDSVGESTSYLLLEYARRCDEQNK